MPNNALKVDYKGRGILTDVSHSGSNGPYRASFMVSRIRAGNWEPEHQGFIEQDFLSEAEARQAADAAARTWIDEHEKQ